jgi:hypothetical protein
MPPPAFPPVRNEQGMPHTSTTNPFAEIQVVPMFILSPKVIQRFVRRQTRHPCCIHRMTNKGQTGEQKLNNFSMTAPLPPMRWGKTASAVAAAPNVQAAEPESTDPAASLAGWAKACSYSPPERRQLRQRELQPRSRSGARLSRVHQVSKFRSMATDLTAEPVS